MEKKLLLTLLPAIIIFGAVLRFSALDFQSPWNDELSSLNRINIFIFCFLAAPAQAKNASDINATTRIVYAHGDKQYSNIYTIKPDGTDRRQLTDARAKDWEPAWSPDGTRIAFKTIATATGSSLP